jgi:hypothetical protein
VECQNCEENGLDVSGAMRYQSMRYQRREGIAFEDETSTATEGERKE